MQKLHIDIYEEWAKLSCFDFRLYHFILGCHISLFEQSSVPHEGRQVPRSDSARQGATMLNPRQAPARARSLGESQLTVCARKGATKAWLERVLGHDQ